MKNLWKYSLVLGIILMLVVSESDDVYYVLGPIGLFIPPLIFLYGVFGYIRNRKRKEYEPPSDTVVEPAIIFAGGLLGIVLPRPVE